MDNATDSERSSSHVRAFVGGSTVGRPTMHILRKGEGNCARRQGLDKERKGNREPAYLVRAGSDEGLESTRRLMVFMGRGWLRQGWWKS